MSNFIHLYETHSCLWQTNSPEYKNRDKRQQALENIVEEMKIPNFTVNDCKNKIKNIRSHYCQELKKIKNSMKSGMGTQDIYKPTLPWFHILDGFLRHKNLNVISNFSFADRGSRIFVHCFWINGCTFCNKTSNWSGLIRKKFLNEGISSFLNS